MASSALRDVQLKAKWLQAAVGDWWIWCKIPYMTDVKGSRKHGNTHELEKSRVVYPAFNGKILRCCTIWLRGNNFRILEVFYVNTILLHHFVN